MRKLLPLIFITAILALSTHAQKKDDPLPLANLETALSVNFKTADIDWLQYGGSIVATVLVDKKGKITLADLTGPGAPCSDLRSEHLVSLRTAAADAVKKAKISPARDTDGNPVDSGAKFTIKVPATVPVPAPAATPLPNGQLPVVRPKMINAGIVNGKAIHLERPAYPQAARGERAGGVVSVQVLIDESGTVLTVDAINGHPDLRYASEEAACKAKFTPTLLQGQPIKVSGILTYNFVP